MDRKDADAPGDRDESLATEDTEPSRSTAVDRRVSVSEGGRDAPAVAPASSFSVARSSSSDMEFGEESA